MFLVSFNKVLLKAKSKKTKVKLNKEQKSNEMCKRYKEKRSFLSFLKDHVTPQLGLSGFENGEGINFKEDSFDVIGTKLKENIKIGLKLTIRF